MIYSRIENPHKGSSKAKRIKVLVAYICAPQNENENEKCIESGALGFDSDDIQIQIIEMLAVAEGGVRSKDPIAHLVFSWQYGECPTREQVEEAVDIILKTYGLEGHQVIWGLHADTDNYHIHLAINRVREDDYSIARLGKDGLHIDAGHLSLALIEHKQGWKKQENALYSLNEKGEWVKRETDKSKKRIPQKVRDKEIATGEKSALRIAQEVAAPIIVQAKSWPELHAELQKHGIRYERFGSGAKLFVGDVPIKASDADYKASLPKLQKRLGIFQPIGMEKPYEFFQHTPKPYPDYLRERSQNGMRKLSECGLAYDRKGQDVEDLLHVDARPDRSKSRTVRRQSELQTSSGSGSKRKPEPIKKGLNDSPEWVEYTALRHLYSEGRKTRFATEKARQETERLALAVKQKAERDDLKSVKWKGLGDVLNSKRSILARDQAAEKAELKERHATEIVRLRKEPICQKFPSYKEWLVLKKENGQQLADEWRYRLNQAAMPCRLIGKNPQNVTRDIRDYRYRVAGQTVIYSAKGKDAFADRGRNIDVIDMRNPASVLAAMQLGAQKFGALTLTGNDEFKALCVQLAVQHNIKIANPELVDAVRLERAKQAQAITTRPAPEKPPVPPATSSDASKPAAPAPELPKEPPKPIQAPIVTQRDFYAELVSEVMDMSDGKASIAERTISQMYGTVFAVNERYGAMSLGHGNVVIIDRQKINVDLGAWEPKGGKLISKAINANNLIALERALGQKVSRKLKEKQERDIRNEKDGKDRGR